LLENIENMIQDHRVHNINFVTPDHFFPHVFRLVSLLRKDGFDLPVLFNLSGYQAPELLKIAEDYTDIYLPDFKYSDTSLAVKLSTCRDYPDVALKAIGEMVKQKGFFDTFLKGSEMAKKGVLVRHLILPGKVENSVDALTRLFLEFGKDLPLSLMSQYHPVARQKDEALNRLLSHEEFDSVYAHAMDLGFENLFVQFPENRSGSQRAHSPFLPDFQQADPFSLP
jgi:putative pyruvate formate lyase activating enzyme